MPAERPNDAVADPVADPVVAPPYVESFFRIGLSWNPGAPWIRLGQLVRMRHSLVVNLVNIEVRMSQPIWYQRNIPRGTGVGFFNLVVCHDPNVLVTFNRVEEWLMATFTRIFNPGEVLVTQYEPRGNEEQNREENVFFPVLLVAPPPAQT